MGDATALPFPDDSYDVALCQMGPMFIEDRAAALTETRRVLAPGGRLVINTPGRIQPAFELMEQAIVEHISPELGGFVRAVFSMHDPDAVATLLRDAGFEDVSSKSSSKRKSMIEPTSRNAATRVVHRPARPSWVVRAR